MQADEIRAGATYRATDVNPMVGRRTGSSIDISCQDDRRTDDPRRKIDPVVVLNGGAPHTIDKLQGAGNHGERASKNHSGAPCPRNRT